MSGLALAGRHLVIVGAASGIGQRCAVLAASEGARLTLMDRGDMADGAGVIARHRLDIASRAEVEAAFAGLDDVDAVVVTAAICPLDDWQANDWDAAFDRVMDVNLRGSINLARAALPLLAPRKGTLVLSGSVAGRMGGLVSSPHYLASKGGVHALVRWLAQKAAPQGVRVNAIAPGPVLTPMLEPERIDTARIPLGRCAEPDEIAWPLLFLASARASYISGAVLDVNGGFHVS
ncbi:SDR family NAD(P)-dependent oxidoreductase [Pararhodobacter sp.]|uniref:SDR family NAD(P)-dependent oxidoreductase n=1 Tax=Pararhodobacter sp. TaxID=2127056 RepID=UPI002FDDF86A